LGNAQLLEHDEMLAANRAKAEDEFEAAEGAGGNAAPVNDSIFG